MEGWWEGLTGCDVEAGMPSLIVNELELAGRGIVEVDATEALEDEAGRVGQPGRRGHVFADVGEPAEVCAIDVDEPEIGRETVGERGRNAKQI